MNTSEEAHSELYCSASQLFNPLAWKDRERCECAPCHAVSAPALRSVREQLCCYGSTSSSSLSVLNKSTERFLPGAHGTQTHLTNQRVHIWSRLGYFPQEQMQSRLWQVERNFLKINFQLHNCLSQRCQSDSDTGESCSYFY